MNCLVGGITGGLSINFFTDFIHASNLEGLFVGFIVEVEDVWDSCKNTFSGPFTFLKSVLLCLVLGAGCTSAQFNLQGVVVVNHLGLPFHDGYVVSALRFVN